MDANGAAICARERRQLLSAGYATVTAIQSVGEAALPALFAESMRGATGASAELSRGDERASDRVDA